ncbi:luciferase domain-containing protein [Halostella litorea]|uniref:luciferase domain-containing protein n=1 Tax=Halostella litorea TaxID=2528831 RepID=UPI001386C005|nr:luciferase family protein [Halostella litorea]
MVSDREAVANAVDDLVDEAGGWRHVQVGEHRFGGTEFRVGPREIGHVHAWGMVDIAYLRKLRDVLVDAGHTGPHHLLPESGWTTYYVESPDDYDHARWLLRLSYLYHVNALKRTPAGAEEFADVDVAADLDELDPDGAVRDAFERR